MIIDTGSKGFWLGFFFLFIMINAICLIPLGIFNANKHDSYDWGDALNGIILAIISIGWWFAV